MFMNYFKEPKVSEVVDDQDGVTNDSVPERRPKPATTAKKTVRIEFHTFTLKDIKVLAWT